MSLRETDGGWEVGVALDGERVEREVGELADAAVWVESWLVPLLEAAGPAEALPDPEAPRQERGDLAAQASSPSVSQANGTPASAQAEPTEGSSGVSGQLSAFASLAQSNDGASWGGAALGGQLTLNAGLWFGATGAYMFDPLLGGDSRAGDDLSRRSLRLSIRGGAHLRLGGELVLDLGIGTGLLSAYAEQGNDGASLKDDEGALLLEAIAVLGFELKPELALLGGITAGGLVPLEGGESEDPEDLLPTLHELEATLLLGIGYRFGSAP